ncbi:DUF4238 domain-containing protein, partial [bacterium]
MINTQTEENVRQHFIPKAYLKNFSFNRKEIYVYDKYEDDIKMLLLSQTRFQKQT